MVIISKTIAVILSSTLKKDKIVCTVELHAKKLTQILVSPLHQYRAGHRSIGLTA